MNANGVLITIVGLWALFQLFGGNALGRLKFPGFTEGS